MKTPLESFFWALERAYRVEESVLGLHLGYDLPTFLQRGWLRPDGYLTHTMIPFLDSEELVEVEVDEVAGVFYYLSPQRRDQRCSRPLDEIALYQLQLPKVLDEVRQLLTIEPSQVSRRPCLIDNHLWHLGNVRLAGTHTFAPLFVGRQLHRTPHALLQQTLADPLFDTGGIVLTLIGESLPLPRQHQCRAWTDFLREENGITTWDTQAMDRMLRGWSAEASNEPAEWFEEKTGYLKLNHLEKAVKFTGIQKKIITVFWNARHTSSLTWVEVRRLSNSAAKELERAFGGNKPWSLFFERVSYGHYRLRCAN